MMERVRPAQLTTMGVSSSPTKAGRRWPSSAFGQETEPGMVILRNSAGVRPSSSTSRSPPARLASNSCAVRRGVWQTSSTTSPKALLGRLTPLKRVKPAASQPGAPPAQSETSV